MSLVPCPGCGLPRDASELDSRPCPICGDAPDGEPAPVAAVAPARAAAPPTPAPEPLPQSGSTLRVLALAAAILLPVVGGAVIYLAWPQPEQVAVDAPKPPPVEPWQTGILPYIERTETAPAPRRVKDMPPMIVGIEEAPAPREAVAVAVVPDPMPAMGEAIVEVNKPDGEYVIDKADGDDFIILKGEVGTLRIGAVTGRAIIDASKLKAKKVIVTGRIDGEGQLKVSAPNGRIEFRERADGASQVVADAPGGVVVFAPAGDGTDGARIDGSAKVTVRAARADFGAKVDGGSQLTVESPGGAVRFATETTDTKAGRKISGGAKVTIEARTVDFAGRLEGGALIRVTTSGSAKITHKEMAGGAKLTYRKATAGDPDAEVSGGDILGGAEVKKVDE